MRCRLSLCLSVDSTWCCLKKTAFKRVYHHLGNLIFTICIGSCLKQNDKTVAFSQKITDALKIVCSILTEDRDGGPDRIPYDVFKKIYFYLSGLNGEATVADIDSVCSYLEEEV